MTHWKTQQIFPAPDVLAREIIEDLEVALSEFVAIAESLEELTGIEDDA